MNGSAAIAASELMLRRLVTVEEAEEKPVVFPIWLDAADDDSDSSE